MWKSKSNRWTQMNPLKSITVTEISKKQKKEKANNSTKIKCNNKISHKSKSLLLTPVELQIFRTALSTKQQEKAQFLCRGCLRWEIALYIASNTLYRSLRRQRIHRGITKTLAKHGGLFNINIKKRLHQLSEMSVRGMCHKNF